MNRTDLIDLFNYNAWANARILAGAERLSTDQLAAPANLDHGSAFQTLLHMVDVEWSWRLMAQRIPTPTVLWELETLTELAHIKAYWHVEQAQMLSYIQNTAEQTLNALVEYGTPQGWPPQSAKLWQILAHVVNHGTQHRTELARYLTDCGHSPGDLSLLGFLSIKEGGLSA